MANFARIFNIICLVGLLCSWIVLLAGVAKTNDAKVDGRKAGSSWNNNYDYNPEYTRKLLAHGRSLAGKAEEAVGMELALWWWITFFQLLIVILSIIIGLGKLTKYKAVLLSFMNINIALLCYMAHQFVYQSWQFSEADAKGGIVDGYKVTSAGVVGSLVFGFIWIIINASDDGQAAVSPDN